VSSVTCPVCKQAAMSVWQKATMGLLHTKLCKSCGSTLSMPHWTIWIFLVGSLVPVPSFYLGSWIYTVLAILAVALFLGFVQAKVIPLVHRAT
jgi:hypothetical protein